jgi:hypothetical protein
MTVDVEVGKSVDAKPVESRSVEPVVETPTMKICFWTSNLLGLLCGLLFGLAGFGKVSGAMDEMIATTLAPFYGVPPLAFKVLAFFGHFTGGVCMIGGILVKIGANFRNTKADLLETLILMDGFGMCTIAAGAVLQHILMGVSPFTPLVIVFPFPLLRLGYNGWTLPEGNVLSTSIPNKKLLLGFLGVNVFGFLLSIVMHVTIGTVGILHQN